MPASTPASPKSSDLLFPAVAQARNFPPTASSAATTCCDHCCTSSSPQRPLLRLEHHPQQQRVVPHRRQLTLRVPQHFLRLKTPQLRNRQTFQGFRHLRPCHAIPQGHREIPAHRLIPRKLLHHRLPQLLPVQTIQPHLAHPHRLLQLSPLRLRRMQLPKLPHSRRPIQDRCAHPPPRMQPRWHQPRRRREMVKVNRSRSKCPKQRFDDPFTS